jgi:hypothetical protein
MPVAGATHEAPSEYHDASLVSGGQVGPGDTRRLSAWRTQATRSSGGTATFSIN